MFGSKGEYDLAVEVITPLNDDYPAYNQNKGIIHTSEHQGRLLLVLPDRQDLIREVRVLKQTDKYIRHKSDAAASPTFKKVLQGKQEENQERRKRLVDLLDDVLGKAQIYALGNTFDPNGNDTKAIIEQGLEHLIKNIYNKFHYLETLTPEPLKEIKHVLTADDIAQGKLIQDGQEINSRAINEVREYIRLKESSNQPVILSELKDRFAGSPYGWPEWEVILLVARMSRAGEIDLVMDGGKKDPREMVTPLSQSRHWKNIKIYLRKKLGETQLKQARDIGKELFGRIGPENQEQLVQFLRTELKTWKQKLDSFKPMADTGNYPGKEDIDQALSDVNSLLKIQDGYEFVSHLIKNKDQLLSRNEDFHDLEDFFSNQIQIWEELRRAMDRFRPNRHILENQPDAARSLEEMQNMLQAKKPYSLLKDARKHISRVDEINNRVLEEERSLAQPRVEQTINEVKQVLEQEKAGSDLNNESLYPLQQVKRKIEQESSIPDIQYLISQLPDLYNQTMERIDEKTRRDDDKDPEPVKKITKIKLAHLGTKAVLETEEDVNTYVDKVRRELLEAVKQKQKVHIQ